MKNPIPQDWDGVSWCRWSVCWPDSIAWRGLLIGAITAPYRGRFWDEKTGSILAAQEIGNEIFDLNVPLQESIMSCSDLNTLADALRDGLLAIANRPCCGSGGPGAVGGPGSAGAPADTPPYSENTDNGTDAPPGFDDKPAYDAYKCNVANYMIDALAHDVDQFQYTIASGKTVAELAPIVALALAIPIEGVLIFAIIGLLISIGFTVASEAEGILRDVLASHRDDLLCTLLAAGSAEAAETDLQGAIATFIDADSESLVANVYAKTIINYMVSASWTNLLFEKDLSRTYPDATCEACLPETSCIGGYLDENLYGEIVSDTYNPVTGRRTIRYHSLSNGGYPAYIEFRGNVAQECVLNLVSYNVVSGTWNAFNQIGTGMVYGSLSDTPTGSSDWVFDPGDFVGVHNHWVLVSNTEFTIDVVLEETP